MVVFKKEWLNDIRFWILVFFLLRMYGITNAPLEMGHNWRQSLTNMIARNFLQMDNNILYPRADVDGNNTGIMATEFPFFNYLIYLTSKIFGYAHWYGRLINLIVSTIGTYYFYKTIQRFINQKLAFHSTLILLSSLWFAYSRKSMPDTFCISLVIIGIYYGLLFMYENRKLYLLLFAVLSSLAVLCKIPAVYLLSVLIIPFFDKNIQSKIKIQLSLAGICVLIIMYAWYFYWDPILLSTFHFQLYYPRGLFQGLGDLIAYAPDTFEKFYFIALESFVAFGIFLFGLFFMIKQMQKLMLLIFGITSFVFFIFMCKTGYVFSTHSYYIIPFVPVMALITGYGIGQFKNRKLQIALLFIISMEGILNQQNDFRIKDSEKYKLNMEQMANRFTSRNDLVAINGGQNPQEMYFLNRKGWNCSNQEISDSIRINSMKEKGCKYIFIDKNYMPVVDLSAKFKEIYSDENFAIYNFQKK